MSLLLLHTYVILKYKKNIFKSMIVVYRHAKYNTFVEVLCVKISLWLTNDHN